MTKSVQIIWNQTDQRLKLGKENKTKNKNVIWIKSNLFRAMHLWFNLFKDIVEYESIYFWWDIFVVVTHWSSYSALKLRPIVNRTTNIDGFLTGHECIIIKYQLEKKSVPIIPSSLGSNTITGFNGSACRQWIKRTFLGREPWSSGYGSRLTYWRSWVRILVLYTGWTFFLINLL